MPGINTFALALATWFGCGNSRVAPGTLGALGALPLYLLMRAWSPAQFWSLTLGLCLLGTWAAAYVAAQLGEKDPQRIVIDEVTGVLIALGCVQQAGWGFELSAVVLFRALDITKPGPVRWAEHARPRSLGIMADDWVAGLVAGGLCWLAQQLYVG